MSGVSGMSDEPNEEETMKDGMTAEVKRPTPRAVAQALELMRRLGERTPREKAEARFDHAKAEFNAAAEAVLNQDVGAAQRADHALAEFNIALEALRRLDGAE